MSAMRAQIRPQQAHGRRVVTLRVRTTLKGAPSGASLRVTDVMLQAGTIASGWMPHVTELPWTAGVVGD